MPRCSSISSSRDRNALLGFRPDPPDRGDTGDLFMVVPRHTHTEASEAPQRRAGGGVRAAGARGGAAASAEIEEAEDVEEVVGPERRGRGRGERRPPRIVD